MRLPAPRCQFRPYSGRVGADHRFRVGSAQREQRHVLPADASARAQRKRGRGRRVDADRRQRGRRRQSGTQPRCRDLVGVAGQGELVAAAVEQRHEVPAHAGQPRLEARAPARDALRPLRGEDRVAAAHGVEPVGDLQPVEHAPRQGLLAERQPVCAAAPVHLGLAEFEPRRVAERRRPRCAAKRIPCPEPGVAAGRLEPQFELAAPGGREAQLHVGAQRQPRLAGGGVAEADREPLLGRQVGAQRAGRFGADAGGARGQAQQCASDRFRAGHKPASPVRTGCRRRPERSACP